MGWEVLVELSAALGDELGLDTGPMVLERLAGEVPFYAGLTHEEIGAMGARWQQRDAAAALPSAPPEPAEPPTTAAAEPPEDSRLRLGTYRDLWAGGVAERNPALRFLEPRQTLELAPADAERLGVENGQPVRVSSNGYALQATAAVRARVSQGAGFLIDGTAKDNANLLGGAELVEVTPVEGE